MVSVMDAFGIHFGSTMATLTIKNLPDEIYRALSETAKRNRRSINSEAIVSVERGLDRPEPRDRMALLEDIRRHREKLAAQGVTLTDEILAQSRAELIRRSERVFDEIESARSRSAKDHVK